MTSVKSSRKNSVSLSLLLIFDQAKSLAVWFYSHLQASFYSNTIADFMPLNSMRVTVKEPSSATV
jgi:hypothetical protein